MDLFKKVSNELLNVIKNYLGEVYVNNPKMAANVKFVIPPVQTMCDYSTNAARLYYNNAF